MSVNTISPAEIESARRRVMAARAVLAFVSRVEGMRAIRPAEVEALLGGLTVAAAEAGLVRALKAFARVGGDLEAVTEDRRAVA